MIDDGQDSVDAAQQKDNFREQCRERFSGMSASSVTMEEAQRMEDEMSGKGKCHEDNETGAAGKSEPATGVAKTDEPGMTGGAPSADANYEQLIYGDDLEANTGAQTQTSKLPKSGKSACPKTSGGQKAQPWPGRSDRDRSRSPRRTGGGGGGRAGTTRPSVGGGGCASDVAGASGGARPGGGGGGGAGGRKRTSAAAGLPAIGIGRNVSKKTEKVKEEIEQEYAELKEQIKADKKDDQVSADKVAVKLTSWGRRKGCLSAAKRLADMEDVQEICKEATQVQQVIQLYGSLSSNEATNGDSVALTHAAQYVHVFNSLKELPIHECFPLRYTIVAKTAQASLDLNSGQVEKVIDGLSFASFKQAGSSDTEALDTIYGFWKQFVHGVMHNAETKQMPIEDILQELRKTMVGFRNMSADQIASWQNVPVSASIKVYETMAYMKETTADELENMISLVEGSTDDVMRPLRVFAVGTKLMTAAKNQKDKILEFIAKAPDFQKTHKSVTDLEVGTQTVPPTLSLVDGCVDTATKMGTIDEELETMSALFKNDLGALVTVESHAKCTLSGTGVDLKDKAHQLLKTVITYMACLMATYFPPTNTYTKWPTAESNLQKVIGSITWAIDTPEAIGHRFHGPWGPEGRGVFRPRVYRIPWWPWGGPLHPGVPGMKLYF